MDDEAYWLKLGTWGVGQKVDEVGQPFVSFNRDTVAVRLKKDWSYIESWSELGQVLIKCKDEALANLSHIEVEVRGRKIVDWRYDRSPIKEPIVYNPDDYVLVSDYGIF